MAVLSACPPAACTLGALFSLQNSLWAGAVAALSLPTPPPALVQEPPRAATRLLARSPPAVPPPRPLLQRSAPSGLGHGGEDAQPMHALDLLAQRLQQTNGRAESSSAPRSGPCRGRSAAQPRSACPHLIHHLVLLHRPLLPELLRFDVDLIHGPATPCKERGPAQRRSAARPFGRGARSLFLTRDVHHADGGGAGEFLAQDAAHALLSVRPRREAAPGAARHEELRAQTETRNAPGAEGVERGGGLQRGLSAAGAESGRKGRRGPEGRGVARTLTGPRLLSPAAAIVGGARPVPEESREMNAARQSPGVTS